MYIVFDVTAIMYHSSCVIVSPAIEVHYVALCSPPLSFLFNQRIRIVCVCVYYGEWVSSTGTRTPGMKCSGTASTSSLLKTFPTSTA